jgi:predicted house-cleaning noncanonical NTP pyrophosphatase (MazG superfamily)
MPRYRFEKLVRDKIVELQLKSGSKPNYRELTDDEHKTELIKKVIEEAREVLKAEKENVAGEIADVQQALDDLVEKFGFTKADIRLEQRRKKQKNGAFKKGLYVNYLDIDDDHEWADYYKNNTDSYPEIN